MCGLPIIGGEAAPGAPGLRTVSGRGPGTPKRLAWVAELPPRTWLAGLPSAERVRPAGGGRVSVRHRKEPEHVGPIPDA